MPRRIPKTIQKSGEKAKKKPSRLKIRVVKKKIIAKTTPKHTAKKKTVHKTTNHKKEKNLNTQTVPEIKNPLVKPVSRAEAKIIHEEIEHNLDREETDFSLDVASAGVSEPLVNTRQYIKNVGRKLAVKTQDGQTVEGNLTKADSKELGVYNPITGWSDF